MIYVYGYMHNSTFILPSFQSSELHVCLQNVSQVNFAYILILIPLL